MYLISFPNFGLRTIRKKDLQCFLLWSEVKTKTPPPRLINQLPSTSDIVIKPEDQQHKQLSKQNAVVSAIEINEGMKYKLVCVISFP